MGLWRTVVNATKRAGRVVTYPIAHPSRTLAAGGTAVKTAVVGGGAAYVGWEALVNDKPVVETVTDLVVGEETAVKLSHTARAAVDTLNTTADAVNTVAHTANQGINAISGALGGGSGNGQGGGAFAGMGNFMTALTSGNGVNMIGDFFGNIGRGNVSGLSIAGLIGAALLIFGRFGWLGKIIGAVLGMMILGGNINMGRVMGGGESQAQQQSPAQAVVPVQQSEVAATPLRRGR